jgi:hypothetical protein
MVEFRDLLGISELRRDPAIESGKAYGTLERRLHRRNRLAIELDEMLCFTGSSANYLDEILESLDHATLHTALYRPSRVTFDCEKPAIGNTSLIFADQFLRAGLSVFAKTSIYRLLFDH